MNSDSGLRSSSSRFHARRGLSLVEVTVSTLLVGLIVVGAMRCLANSVKTGEVYADRTLAFLLAEDLMEEILQQDYTEPDVAARFGLEGAESEDERAEWDDVDDYHGWKASPPQDRAGTPVDDSSWTRKVSVVQVSAEDLKIPLDDDDDRGVKRITVMVFHNGTEVAQLVSVQTKAWISMIPQHGESTTTGQLPPVNTAPAAAIASHTMSGSGSISVDFDASGSLDPEGSPLDYHWDFGDSATTAVVAPTHVFRNAGSKTIVYSVVLTVTDIHGAENSAATTVTVHP